MSSPRKRGSRDRRARPLRVEGAAAALWIPAFAGMTRPLLRRRRNADRVGVRRALPMGARGGPGSKRAAAREHRDREAAHGGFDHANCAAYAASGDLLAKGTQSKAPIVKTAIMIHASLIA